MEIQNINKTATLFKLRPFVSKISGDLIGFNGAGFYAKVKGDVNGFNGALGIAYAYENVSGFNGALGGTLVDENVSGFNGALVGALVGGDVSGFNGALGIAYADENVSGFNGALGIGYIKGTLKDTTLGGIFPKLTKYLPNSIKEIALPSFNIGLITKTGNTKNAVIFGLYNEIKKTDDDYLAFGLVNRIMQENGKYKTSFFADGRITIDGIFRHKESKLEEEIACNNK